MNNNFTKKGKKRYDPLYILHSCVYSFKKQKKNEGGGHTCVQTMFCFSDHYKFKFPPPPLTHKNSS